MPLDDDDADDVGGFASPPSPDDRLWRHPSELWSLGQREPRPAAVAAGPRPDTRAALWQVALVSGLVGATLAGGILTVTGALDSEVTRSVVEKVAVTPMVSSPMIDGERGVTALAERMRPSVVRLVITSDGGTSWSSAVVYRDDGLLLASAREVTGSKAITAVLHDGRSVDAELLGADLATDVAVVSVDADGLAVAVLGTSADVEVGAPIVALACNPKADEPPLVVTGVISALEQRVDLEEGSLHGMIQTDAPVEAAWHGGPLLDATGAVIGIGSPGGGDDARFGYATPIDLVRTVAQQLVAEGRVRHGWLGIDGTDISNAVATAIGIDGGALVRGVMEGSPAAEAGLVANDIITELGGYDVVSSSELVVALRALTPGETVKVAYWRDGQLHRTEITIGERP